MEGESKKLELRKKAIVAWIKENIAILGILAFAFIIRLYYFWLTRNQPLWWDEAIYGSLAKNFLYGKWAGTETIAYESVIRPLLLSRIWFVLIWAGIPEIGVRFFLEFLPSFVAVFFVYLIGKELYDKRVGLVSAFIFSVLWIHLFYTARLLTNVPALPLLFASIYLFFKSVEDKFNAKYFGISLFLLSLATLMRYPNGIIFIAYALFLALVGKIHLIRKKGFWTSGFLGILPMILFFISNQIKYGNIFPAILGGNYAQADLVKPIAFNVLNNIPLYLKTVFFVFFIFGLLFALYNLIIGYDFIRKKNKLKGNLIILIIFALIFSYFIFYMKGAEDRWLFPTSICLVYFAALGLMAVYDLIRPYQKTVAMVFVVLVLAIGAYSQLKFSDNLIDIKKDSYLQVEQGFEWLKENSPAGSIVMGHAIQPYAMYYSEREYIELPQNESEIYNLEDSADYIVIHGFRPHPDYVNNYLRENDKWSAVNAYFFDKEKTQPALVIFRRNY